MRTDIEEIVLAIVGVWVKTKVQLELLRNLLDSKLLISDLSAHYLNTVKQLEMKISAAVVGLGIMNRRRLGLSGSKLPIGSQSILRVFI
jgi:hypothetical protein